MGFELIDRESRSLPPVRTGGIDAETTQEDPSKSTSSEEGECVTPKSEQHAVKRPLVCPSAPRKPRPVKRKLQPPPDGFYPVPSDLASIFIPLPCPVIKKIRVGS